MTTLLGINVDIWENGCRTRQISTTSWQFLKEHAEH